MARADAGVGAIDEAGSRAERGGIAYIGVALFAATAYACGSTTARLAYEGGSDALSVSTARTVTAAIVLFLFLRARGVPLRLPRRERLAALLCGPLLAGYSFCLYSAIGYVPVALGVLTFYTYPLLTGIFAWGLGDSRPTWRAAAALAVAFVGLILALDVTGAGLDVRGIAFALAGAAGLAALLLATARIASGGDSRPRTLHMLVSASVCFLLVCVLAGHFAPPRTASGWGALGASVTCYCFAVVSMFAATAALGPVKTGLVMNFEPVASMILGVLVLGQTLGPLQVLGAALVLGAILVGRAPAPRVRAGGSGRRSPAAGR